MRKFLITGVAALGFLTLGLTVMGHAATFRQTDAEGAAADPRLGRPDVTAMVETGIEQRVRTLAANTGYAALARSLLVG